MIVTLLFLELLLRNTGNLPPLKITPLPNFSLKSGAYYLRGLNFASIIMLTFFFSTFFTVTPKPQQPPLVLGTPYSYAGVMSWQSINIEREVYRFRRSDKIDFTGTNPRRSTLSDG